jgi:eukaryotic-like serine/threonine-protein kinase
MVPTDHLLHMPPDPRIPPILDRLPASQVTPQEVCAVCPDLLPKMRSRWQQMRRNAYSLGALLLATTLI